MRSFARWTLVSLLAVTGCGGDTEDADTPPPRPTAPATNDPAFDVQGVRGWYLIGNELTPGHDQLSATVAAPAGVERVWAFLGARAPVALDSIDGRFTLTAELGELGVGSHELLLSADRDGVAFARFELRRSHPLYVVVSVDWDLADAMGSYLLFHEDLHTRHDDLKITHFFGPYTMTDPTLRDSRRALLLDWIRSMRDDWGDEIGLHIHPYCNFVETTDVSCRHEPSSSRPNGDESGYSIILASYTEEEMSTLLRAADRLFIDADLGKPTSFRAGGWTAELHTLRALADNGYVVDSSANNWRRMEEWMGAEGTVLYDWNMQTWGPIDDTSQPYYPSETDMLRDAAPTLPLLEVPDNGILVDYVTAEEMIDVFEANFDGTPLSVPTLYQIGFHANNFRAEFFDRIDDALDHSDQFRASTGDGPVVYTNISDLPRVWRAP